MGQHQVQNPADKTFDHTEYVSMCQHLFTKVCDASAAVALRKDAIITILIVTLLFSTAARSDESLQLLLCDMVRPMLMPTVGPSPAWFFQFSAWAAKNNKSGRPDILYAAPHADPKQCCLICLATFLYWRFAVQKQPFPDPLNHYTDQWWVRAGRAGRGACVGRVRGGARASTTPAQPTTLDPPLPPQAHLQIIGI